MQEIRWHGRGGQGAFTVARLLGQAVSLYEDKYAMAFPSFGPERRGAPVLSFTRIDEDVIRDRSDVVECDYAVVLDETLFGPAVKKGLKENATVVINSVKDADAFPIEGCTVVTVDATSLALKVLGRAITNVPMLGALIAASGIADLESACKAIDTQLSERVREKNKELLKLTCDAVKERMGK
ncbi:MAG: 2-oxoacid:acceptor oxidoreductase family protein [Clostridiales Family XIII bacterium]|jgi:pyruvate ferredoxin oxidoreductase gamma subunit|nr:2-oxoacid:acceptor oxidoreductase family protein [Clostridiales Family XIII bacterium]